MDKMSFERAVADFIKKTPENYIAEEAALRPDLAGMGIFDEPIFGYASAADPYFPEAKKPGIIGVHFMTPGEWLPGAETVIAAFLPFTEKVRAANRERMDWPADEWLHARVEGQAFQNMICHFMEETLKKEGASALAPMIDPRFSRYDPVTRDKTPKGFSSNWSERHAAYAAGLGTFGLSKGLITRKGVAGRYISVITGAFFEPDKRPYTGIYDYCSKCGACARNCPAKAISLKTGKDHFICSEFVDNTARICVPRYGCGKCQVKVPCETKAAAGI